MRVLVLRLSALGDVIHTIPAVVALRSAMPDTEIAWVVESPYRELVELVARVDTIPVSMKKWGRSLIASRHDIGRTLRAMRSADSSIDFQGLIKSASLPWVAGAKRRYGFERRVIREKPAAWFINRPIAVDATRHVVEWNLDLASGVAAAEQSLSLRERVAEGRVRGQANANGESATPLIRRVAAPSPGGRRIWETFAADPDAKLRDLAGRIVFLPGAGRSEKLWPSERFRELAQHLGDHVVVAWGPGEKQLAEAIGAQMAPPTNLRELAELLRSARLVVGADTGPLHLAAALGTRVVGLYGPTSSRRNGPYGQLEHCIDVFPSTKSMSSIGVADVIRKIEQVMQ